MYLRYILHIYRICVAKICRTRQHSKLINKQPKTQMISSFSNTQIAQKIKLYISEYIYKFITVKYTGKIELFMKQ